MKYIAFYLPQYHQIPENDEWWGKGFTEWTNVKKSKKLFLGHYQPREPLNDNYYDLIDENVMREQMKLAKKSGIYGFCFYHYWFCGKKLLEKPLEKMLRDETLDFPFCLSWANEPWTRTWNGDLAAKEVLMPQKYGDKKDWKEHFDYLLEFFKNKNYIMKNGKPVFIIYRLQNIPKYKEMLQYWEELAIANGFEGIYYAQMNTSFGYLKDSVNVDAVIDFEPHRILNSIKNDNVKWDKKRKIKMSIRNKCHLLDKILLNRINYDDLCNEMVKDSKVICKDRYYGVFSGFDNSARRKERATIIEGNTPKEFQKYLEIQTKRSVKENREFVFINAWNEWGEGAYLEPDKKYGYAFLNVIKRMKKRYG